MFSRHFASHNVNDIVRSLEGIKPGMNIDCAPCSPRRPKLAPLSLDDHGTVWSSSKCIFTYMEVPRNYDLQYVP